MFKSRTSLLDPAFVNMIRISSSPTPSTKLLFPVGHPLAVQAGMVYHSGMGQVVGACVGMAVLDGAAMLIGDGKEEGEKERGVKAEDVVRGTLGGLSVGWVLREVANVRMKATASYTGLGGLPGLVVGVVYYFMSVSLASGLPLRTLDTLP